MTGGPTSHAAVWRALGKPCVVGAHEVAINYAKNEFSVTALAYVAAIGYSGWNERQRLGARPRSSIPSWEDFHQLMRWADKHRRMRVRANGHAR